MDMQLRAIAVDLDFMQPSGTIGRAISQDRITWIDECGEWRALRAKDSSDNSAVSPALQRNGTHPGSIAPRDSKRDSLPLTARLNGSERALTNSRCRPLLSSSRTVDEQCRTAILGDVPFRSSLYQSGLVQMVPRREPRLHGSLGRTGGTQLPQARMFRRTDEPSMEPSLPPVSCTYVCKLFSGRTIFLGPKTEQRLVHLIIFRLPHAPTRLPGDGFD